MDGEFQRSRPARTPARKTGVTHPAADTRPLVRPIESSTAAPGFGTPSKANGWRSLSAATLHVPPQGAGAVNAAPMRGRPGQKRQSTATLSPPPVNDPVV